jgi:hypothetical protein
VKAAVARLAGMAPVQASPRLDNVHRFMAGVYVSTGIICLLAGCGRLLSIAKVGSPKPAVVWLGYLVPELLVPFIMATAQFWGH